MDSGTKKSNPLFSNNYKTTDFIWAASLGEGKYLLRINLSQSVKNQEKSTWSERFIRTIKLRQDFNEISVCFDRCFW